MIALHNLVEGIIDDKSDYRVKNNRYRFILNDDERPDWSIRLNDYLLKNKRPLYMKRMYNMAKLKMNKKLDMYFKYITENGGIIIDLASGPSGYFAPVFEYMADDSIFIITDACQTILNEHQRKCAEPNFALFDIDLDKKLPIKDNCISSFCGNYISNVENLEKLISEVSRCLKSGGRFAVKEIFYEEETETFIYLKNKKAINASETDFVESCRENGLILKDSVVNNIFIGKLTEGDFLPIGMNDKGIEKILFFEKFI